MADGGRDLLYALRNNFHLGAYQAALGEAQDLQHDDLGGAETVERDVFMYRAYIELGQPEVCLTEVTDDSELALQACKLLALVKALPTALSVRQTVVCRGGARKAKEVSTRDNQ